MTDTTNPADDDQACANSMIALLRFARSAAELQDLYRAGGRSGHLRPAPGDVRTRTRAITALLESAESSSEIEAVQRVGARGGYLRTCPSCLEANYLDRTECHECRTPLAVDGAPADAG